MITARYNTTMASQRKLIGRCLVWFRNDLRFHDNEVSHSRIASSVSKLPFSFFKFPFNEIVFLLCINPGFDVGA